MFRPDTNQFGKSDLDPTKNSDLDPKPWSKNIFVAGWGNTEYEGQPSVTLQAGVLYS